MIINCEDSAHRLLTGLEELEEGVFGAKPCLAHTSKFAPTVFGNFSLQSSLEDCLSPAPRKLPFVHRPG